MEATYAKIKRRIWREIVSRTRHTGLYSYLYKSYWYALFFPQNVKESNTLYLAARPNPGAGIGHQLANWIAGYWWAKQFELPFAHIPFSTEKWEHFFEFGSDEMSLKELVHKGYRVRRIPLFDENKPEEKERVKRIIAAYSGTKTVLLCEQDQFYRDQFGVMDDLQNKFYHAEKRKSEQLSYLSNQFNIAIHVRRGDIVIGQENKNPNLQMRYQGNDYFYNVLSNTLKNLKKIDKPIAVYLFSQGVESDFNEFKEIPNLHFCLDMGAQESFLHMINADILITSKSSFSYKPALMNKGIKISPQNFWHSYPESEDWILADENGNIDEFKLQRAL